MRLFTVYYSFVTLRNFGELTDHSSALKTHLNKVFKFVGWFESGFGWPYDRIKVYVLVAAFNAFLECAGQKLDSGRMMLFRLTKY